MKQRTNTKLFILISNLHHSRKEVALSSGRPDNSDNMDNSDNIQIGFSSIMHRSDKDFSKEISELNVKLKKYCLGRGFIYVDNDNVNESCLNNSELHLNKKGTNLFSKNIPTSLDVI